MKAFDKVLHILKCRQEPTGHCEAMKHRNISALLVAQREIEKMIKDSHQIKKD